MKRLLALVVLMLVTSCSKTVPRTEVMVIIQAEGQLRTRIDRVEVDVNGGSMIDIGHDPTTLELPVTSPISWPIVLGLVPRDGDGSRQYEVIAEAYEAGVETPLLTVRARSVFVKERTVVLRLLFEQACVDEVCTGGQTCRGGMCSNAAVPSAELIPFTPDSLRDDLPLDAGPPDAGRVDGGPGDGGPVDSGAPDSGSPPDSGPPDGGCEGCGDISEPCCPAECGVCRTMGAMCCAGTCVVPPASCSDGNNCTNDGPDPMSMNCCGHSNRSDGPEPGGTGHCCGGRRVDSLNSCEACGACGVACSSGQACTGGMCMSGGAVCS